MRSLSLIPASTLFAALFAGCAAPAPPTVQALDCQAIASANAAFDDAGSSATANCELAKSLKPSNRSLSGAFGR